MGRLSVQQLLKEAPPSSTQSRRCDEEEAAAATTAAMEDSLIEQHRPRFSAPTIAATSSATTSTMMCGDDDGDDDGDGSAAATTATTTTTTMTTRRRRRRRKDLTIDDGNDEQWYKRAVFYEVFVRGFSDSDGDGIGDLRGLTNKLDHLAWLGVDVVWLLPITASPLRDHGYDVSDAMRIHADYGTLEDFDTLVAAAHLRGIRVVVELVPNHTSSSHVWFQASRDPTHPLHARFRDWYMWSNTSESLAGTRIIFVDTETSNWTWDERRKAFYFHRFFSHQPDLNMDNPAVQDAVLATIDFWASHGVDGIRVDAAPFLFKREGTTSEGLPETHAFFRRMRKFVDDRALVDISTGQHPHRRRKLMLLCEANLWPHEAAAFFGSTGNDEFSMAFHFPLMPRIFLSLARQSNAPITWALSETPSLMPGCSSTTTTAAAQWGTFLRNHDELTLEMVTSEEREELWRHYAPDPRMRLNLGIRRRLAPLLGNNGGLIRLAHSVLLSTAGSPFLYYGDEIGMGDNIELADRSGVRTPMQWDGNAETNSGFSQAPPSQLFLPLISHGEYGFRKVNVAAQRSDPHSLLNWLRNALAIRAHHSHIFGCGSCDVLGLVDGVPDSALVFFRGFGMTIDDHHVLVEEEEEEEEWGKKQSAVFAIHNLSSTQRLSMTLSARTVIVPRLLREEVNAALLLRMSRHEVVVDGNGHHIAIDSSSSSSSTMVSSSSSPSSSLSSTSSSSTTQHFNKFIGTGDSAAVMTMTEQMMTTMTLERRMSLVGGEQRSIEATELFSQKTQRIDAEDGALVVDLPPHGFEWVRVRFIAVS